ncbi:hypothetical protein [Streptomyces yaizuensis]|uniref:DUF5336 domain-containing protein n=1 Tax=Streptomyces yaizuensis TaxID=2989713 RepID=A0ABQ5NU96_9ACTN|nr:hypothetical protein [Streptomyces sp. YSPA8]GLF93934.1 DUF5336 domain-containing protein [Streptomyces sp. YSPA8]
MNIRSLTRGDGVVIGAAVLLFIASFLDTWDISCKSGQVCPDLESPNAWGNGALLLGVYLAGVVAAALIVLARLLPRPPKVLGIEPGQLGTALTLFVAWTALGAVFDPGGSMFAEMPDMGAASGLILGFAAALLLAAGAVCSQLVPAFKAPLLGAPRPAAPTPYGGQPQGGYGYPGAGAQPFGGGQPQGGQPGPSGASSFGGQPPAAAPAAEFAPFWFAVPVARPLYAEDGSAGQIAELTPGTWYLAVEQRGSGLVAQTQDGRRGVLQDTSGIQRG